MLFLICKLFFRCKLLLFHTVCSWKEKLYRSSFCLARNENRSFTYLFKCENYKSSIGHRPKWPPSSQIRPIYFQNESWQPWATIFTCKFMTFIIKYVKIFWRNLLQIYMLKADQCLQLIWRCANDVQKIHENSTNLHENEHRSSDPFVGTEIVLVWND